jgi:hypothetical protein
MKALNRDGSKPEAGGDRQRYYVLSSHWFLPIYIRQE